MVRFTQQPEMNFIKRAIFYHYRRLLVLIFCLALVLEYFLAVHPLREMTRNNEALDMQFYKTLLAEERQMLDKLEKLNKEADSLDQRSLSKLDDVMASGINIPQMLNEFYLIAQDSGYQLNNIAFAPEDGVYHITVSFSGGNYQLFKHLLTIIEQNIRIMDITNLSFSGAGESCNFTINTYYLD